MDRADVFGLSQLHRYEDESGAGANALTPTSSHGGWSLHRDRAWKAPQNDHYGALAHRAGLAVHKDLEIRGGNLLGGQSGVTSKVGFGT